MNHNMSNNYRFVFLDNGTVCFLSNESVSVVDIKSQKIVKSVKRQYPSNIQRTKNRLFYYSHVSGKCIEIWDPTAIKKIDSIKGISKYIEGISVNDNLSLIAVIETWNYLRVFDTDTKDQKYKIRYKGEVQMWNVVYDPTGNILVVLRYNPDLFDFGVVDIYDSSSMELLKSINVPRSMVVGDVVINNQSIVLSYWEKTLHIDINTYQVEEKTGKHKIDKLAPNGRLALTMEDNKVTVFDLESDATIKSFIQPDKVFDAKFSPDNSQIGVTTSSDFTVYDIHNQ